MPERLHDLVHHRVAERPIWGVQPLLSHRPLCQLARVERPVCQMAAAHPGQFALGEEPLRDDVRLPVAARLAEYL